MSSSVIMARTRMWRTMVAIMRGGNLCGAAWHRLQLARNRCSPCTHGVGIGAGWAAARPTARRFTLARRSAA
jgi:hypothetical protein